MNYIPVQIKSDDSGHEYIVPNELKDEFNKLSEKGYLDDDWDEFEETFGKFRTGGSVNNYQLHISEQEMNNLTGGKYMSDKELTEEEIQEIEEEKRKAHEAAEAAESELDRVDDLGESVSDESAD